MFTRPMTISTLDGEATREIEGLIDTGASYSLLPASILQDMGVVPVTEANFRLANGGRIPCRWVESRRGSMGCQE